ncbi:MAG TPA: GyrI-like domain-containing protein [Tepidisphaeraceae bacterium]|nr:GyrI-like domain-containing protein [Tepidisphaeraceae bacterium]
MHKSEFCGILVALVVATLGITSTGPADQAAADYQVTPLRVQDMPEVTVYYQTVKTKLPDMSKDFDPVFADYDKALEAGELQRAGPVMLVYHNASFERPFDLDVCFTAPADAMPVEKFQVKKVPSFKCASVVYVGSLKWLGQAYQSLFKQLNGAGLQATGQTREVYLFWGGYDSPNNVTYVQSGIED